MARQMRQPFSPTGEYEAMKAFRYAGKSYKVGDPFPWRKISCSTRKLLQLYEGRFIKIYGDTIGKPGVEELIEETEGDLDGDDLEEDEVEEDSEETSDKFTYDPEIHRVSKSKKKGWTIKQDKKLISRINPKLARKLKEATEPVEIELG